MSRVGRVQLKPRPTNYSRRSQITYVSGAEDGSIMAGPEGARPPSLDGGEPGDHAGPLISEFSFE
ncbi:MAG: hypothetical protein ABSH52_23320, partial [Terriglobia bacterium]